MKRLVLVILILALSLGFAGCARHGDVKALLKPEWLQVVADHRTAGDDRLVLVIGESHSNVQGQLHLTNALERLLAEKQIDTVLVEGSQGPIEINQRLSEISGDLKPADLASYWQQQLNWGQISGWEYVTLIQPNLKAFGVEDMVAKARFAIQSEGGSDAELKREVDSANRGAERLEKALSSLEQSGVSLPEARAAQDRHRQAIQGLAGAIERYSEKRQPLIAKQLELLGVEAELQGIYKETGLADLQQKKASKAQFEEWAVALQRDKPQVAERLAELMKKQEALEAELKLLEEAAVPFANDFAAKHKAVRSSYFALANQLRHAAGSQWPGPSRPPAVSESLRRVEVFFADERAQARKDDAALTRPLLADRDHAMAENTAKYLKDSGSQRVVLIVGAAHLEGITENLQRLGLPYLSSRLLPQEGEEPWEMEAWERRRKAVPPLLSAASMKEPTRLQDDRWWKEQGARIQAWAKAPAEQIDQIKGKDEGDVKVVYRSALLSGAHVRRAEHIEDYGPVPGHPGEIFEAWDRPICKKLVDDLSTDRVEFAHAYFDLDPQKHRIYQTYTRQGTQPLATFLKNRPGKAAEPPSFVVLLAEPDLVQAGASSWSPLWHDAREPLPKSLAKPLATPLAGNNGGGGGQGPNTVASAAAEPERKPDSGDNQSNPQEIGRRVATGGGSGNDNGGGKGPPPSAGVAADPDNGDGRKGGDGHNGSGDDHRDDRTNSEEPPSDRRWTAFYADRRESDPTLVRTTDARRAQENIEVLLQQEPLVPEEVTLVRGTQGLEDVEFTEANGAHAGLVVLLASNVAEFRAAVERAADMEKLTHKQVALITCGHLQTENAELREKLFAAGVVMVWTLERQITEQTGEQLMDQIGETLKQGIKPRNINDLLERSIADLLRANPENHELEILKESGAWVELQPVDWNAIPPTEEVG